MLVALLVFFGLLLSPEASAQRRWMTELHDTLAVTALSIPGAHDAATSSIRGRGRCQALTIAEQLQRGVRAFDLRPTQQRRPTLGGFRTKGLGNIYHGLKDTGTNLTDVFAGFNAFLEVNPQEFIIVLLRDESDGRYLFRKPTPETFTTALSKFLQTQTRVIDFRAGLRVRDCRGRIIVLCRTGSPTKRAATYLTWNHSLDGSKHCRIYYADDAWVPLAVQDCYAPEMAAKSCSKKEFPARKLITAQNFLDFAASANDVWTINHASAYMGVNNYCQNAEWINTRLCRYISRKAKPFGPTGIVMMDFVGVEKAKYRGRTYQVSGDSLLRAVINNNFRE